MASLTEKILLHQIKKGDEHAFTLFYNNHRTEIYRFVFFKVSDEEKANDLTNEVFIKVYAYIKHGKEIENFRPFLFKTARNIVIDFYRSRARDEVPIDEFVEQSVSTQEDLEKDIDAKLKFENVAEAVKQLPEPYKEVITLRFINDLGFEEISQITGESIGNCRIIAHRGIKKIKKVLQK